MTSVKPAAGSPARTRAITILSGVVAVLYAFFVFVPMQRSNLKLQAQLRQKESKASQDSLLVQPIAQLSHELTIAQQLIGHWQASAPQMRTIADAFASIEKAARDAKVELLQFSPEAERSLASIGTVSVALELRSSYRGIHEFLRTIESLPMTTWMEEIELRPDGASDEVLKARTKLIIFFDCGDFSV